MNDLQEDCSRRILKTLSSHTLPDIIQLSQDYCLLHLIRGCFKFIATNLSNSEKWLSDKVIDLLSLNEICDIIKDDDVRADEKEIFSFALRWIKHYISEHGTQFHHAVSTILSCVRFPLMTVEDLTRCDVELARLKVPSELYCHLLEEATTFIDNPFQCSILDEYKTRIRSPVACIVIAGGFTHSESSTNRVQVFSLEELDNVLVHGEHGSSTDMRFLFLSALIHQLSG